LDPTEETPDLHLGNGVHIKPNQAEEIPMNTTNFNRLEEQFNTKIDTRNGVYNVRTYRDSLNRPAGKAYMVRPDGTVEFIR